ncbi:MAG: hypothetical protein NT145_03285 [Elusimicrobia bacterium]|nr:hypothetical protein [Elusimicrobiota bacterium]
MGSLFQSFTRIAVSVFIAYCAFMALLYFSQEKFIFFPQSTPISTLKEIKTKYKNAEEVSIKTSDNVIIRGWLVKNTINKKTPLIIYFGGNADVLSDVIKQSKYFKEWSLGLINYRGYELSEGKPGEKEFYNDALAIYDYFSQRNDIDNKNIVIFGRSIGTGVAVYLAKNRSAKGIILVSPYDSLISIAKKDFPYAPIGLLLRHKFDSISFSSSITAPLLVLIADQDTTVEPEFSENLVKKWGGPYKIVSIKGADHNSMSYSPLYWESINEFLDAFKLKEKKK